MLDRVAICKKQIQTAAGPGIAIERPDFSPALCGHSFPAAVMACVWPDGHEMSGQLRPRTPARASRSARAQKCNANDWRFAAERLEICGDAGRQPLRNAYEIADGGKAHKAPRSSRRLSRHFTTKSVGGNDCIALEGEIGEGRFRRKGEFGCVCSIAARPKN